ncbi:MAG: glutathionylspermidine synthase family protein [Planctomycetota bacterium]
MMADYDTLATDMRAEGRLGDPWCEGAPRFAAAPLRVTPARLQALQAAAAAVAAVHDELCGLVAAAPHLLDDFFQLTPFQKLLWQASAPHWHGIARADVFCTASGPKVCELNSDTPSGQAEADWAGRQAARWGRDANRELRAHFLRLIARVAASVGCGTAATVGIVYPTDLPEDLAMIALYREWLEAAGHRVVLGAPFNLTTARDGRAALFDVPCDVVLRHYKTDWWTERLPVRDDEPWPEDREPLRRPLGVLLPAMLARRTAVVNPFGAVLTQNKRALAFLHEERARFSPAAQAAIARYVPPTFRLEHCRDRLWTQRERFVLKSDYGCEGQEVVLGPAVSQDEWEDALQHAIVSRWVAQAFFDAEREADGNVVNYGVFLCGGVPAGMLARVHAAPTVGVGGTDAAARVVGVAEVAP